MILTKCLRVCILDVKPKTFVCKELMIDGAGIRNDKIFVNCKDSVKSLSLREAKTCGLGLNWPLVFLQYKKFILSIINHCTLFHTKYSNWAEIKFSVINFVKLILYLCK